MNPIKKVFNKLAAQTKKIVLVGAAIVSVSLVANASNGKVGPITEKAQLETVKVDVSKVADVLAKADPKWVESLPVMKEKKAKIALKTAASQTPFIFFPGTDDEDCNAINLNQYVGPAAPPTIPEGVNPEGCDGGDRCCGKAYPAANVQYNPVTNRWEPTSETGVRYFSRL